MLHVLLVLSTVHSNIRDKKKAVAISSYFEQPFRALLTNCVETDTAVAVNNSVHVAT